MKRALKKKLNLTIEESLVDQAKRVAEERGESLSQLVENFLSRLVHDFSQIDSTQASSSRKKSSRSQANWLASFHLRHLKRGSIEPSDRDIDRLLAERDSK